MPTREGNAMFTLHRYFLTASTMRSTFLRWMNEHPEGPFADDSLLFPEFIAHTSVWYSTLFTAWEGWNQLAAQYGDDDVLTRRWEDPLRVMLQDYRNATMHYSRRYLDARLTAFISSAVVRTGRNPYSLRCRGTFAPASEGRPQWQIMPSAAPGDTRTSRPGRGGGHAESHRSEERLLRRHRLPPIHQNMPARSRSLPAFLVA